MGLRAIRAQDTPARAVPLCGTPGSVARRPLCAVPPEGGGLCPPRLFAVIDRPASLLGVVAWWERGAAPTQSEQAVSRVSGHEVIVHLQLPCPGSCSLRPSSWSGSGAAGFAVAERGCGQFPTVGFFTAWGLLCTQLRRAFPCPRRCSSSIMTSCRQGWHIGLGMAMDLLATAVFSVLWVEEGLCEGLHFFFPQNTFLLTHWRS